MGFFSFFSSSKPARQRSKARKRSSQLNMEPLEDRCVPTSTSQAISFVSQQTGGISAPGMFNQFNPNLGTLQSITIQQSGSISSDIKVENTSTLSPASISAAVAGTLNLSGGGVNQNIDLNPITQTFAASIYDGTLDFGGTSGTDFGFQTATGSNSTTLTGSQMTPFVGTGTIAINESSTAGSNATSNVGNLTLTISSVATATVTVTYDYIPNNAGLSGCVYLDGNADGTFNNNEAGISGVTMTLTGTTNLGAPVSTSTTSGANGAYSFQNLARVIFDHGNAPGKLSRWPEQAGLAGAGNGTVGNHQLSSITVNQGDSGSNYNFGHMLPGSLAGTVYLDANNNGTLESSETGISGVTMTLTGTNDLGASVNQTTTTGGNGQYSFQNLRPGSYAITETPPASYLAGKNTVGSLGGTLASNQTTGISLAQNAAGTNYNFAELLPGSLAGTVYLDANNNGTVESNETGMTGVTVTLTGTNDLGTSVSQTTTTGNGGAYSFQNLCPGNYILTETPPSGYLAGKLSAGSLGGSIATNQISAIPLTQNSAGTNYNFAHLMASSMSGFVYADGNNDGVFQSNESGISGVTVSLTGTNDLGAAVNASTTTTGTGAYSFQNLRPGTYTITEMPPTGYLDGKNTLGSLGTTNGTVGNHVLSSVVVGQNAAGVNYNFGEILPGTLSGFVYFDANDNGVMDPGDSGIGSVAITLTGTNDLGPVIVPATTGADGSYQFKSLRPGTYSITENPPANYLPGTNNLGSLGGTVGSNQFSAITVNAGGQGTQYNFGELASTDDLSIAKTVDASSITVGGQVTYTLTVSNQGAATANGVTVTDPLPAGTTYINALGPGWAITNNNGTLSATTASLRVGVSSFFTVTVQVPNTAGSITNTATVTSTTTDSNPNNNQSSVTTEVNDVPGTITQQAIPQVRFGPIPVFSKTQLVGGALNNSAAAQAAFVESVYLTLTGTVPSPTTLASLVLQLQMGTLTPEQLLRQLYFNGPFIQQEITNVYQSILGTAPTPSQLSTAIAQLQSGMSLTDLKVSLFTSPVYLQTHTSPSSMITGLDQAVMGGSPALSAMQVQVQALGATTWNAFVQTQVTSTEAFTQLVRADYQGILGRDPSTSELNAWVGALQNNQVTPDQFMQYLFASAEFMQRALAHS